MMLKPWDFATTLYPAGVVLAMLSGCGYEGFEPLADSDEGTVAAEVVQGRLVQLDTQKKFNSVRNSESLEAQTVTPPSADQVIVPEPPAVDTSLSPEELAVFEDQRRAMRERREQLLKLQVEKSRELRGKNMSPSKRRAEAQAEREPDRSPVYFLAP